MLTDIDSPFLIVAESDKSDSDEEERPPPAVMAAQMAMKRCEGKTKKWKILI